MSQLFLHGTDVHPTLEQVGCETVTQAVAASGFIDSSLANRDLYGFLHAALVHMMTTFYPRVGINTTPAGWKYELPAPLLARFRIFYRSLSGLGDRSEGKMV